MHDDLGHDVPLAQAPARVVSLVPSLTEAVAASAPDLLVGATQWCTHPAGLAVARVRGTKNPDIAAIRALRPDLVVANQEENRRLDVDRLRDAGIPVWVTRIDSVPEALASLGRLFAEGLRVSHPAWLDRAADVWRPAAPATGRRVVAPIWRDPWMVVGADTYAHDVLTRIGLINAGAEQGARYPPMPVTAIADARPDLVVLPDEPYPFTAADGPDALAPLVCRLVPGRALSWYGPAMVDARETLTRLLA
ncbi:helical backbone metal receptor [Propionicicella superfundia]|uniref:helical backbone metal receptor n=1 Tax=Propionicicella superfundia TaxID=348582 RepID=UPI00041B9DAE|nr:helical backbone metal receptor [Propionicicella superfundia]